ncbi:MAG: hypothetical protein IPI42_05885 [Saprospiraceae bacterium]|nr:hypothetical protein [Candidatus Parvibacillus calidus]
MKPKRCLLFTCLIVGFLFFNACNKEDINTNTGSWSGQALNADTLYFDNETQFRDFLFHYGLSRKYEIIPPKYHFSCTVVPLPNNYPEQMRDDYLNEDRFVGKPFINLFDHIATRKYINIFFPTYYENNPGTTKVLNFCDVNEYITNLATGQVVCFKDVFNWYDENGENIFNANKKVWLLWSYNDAVVKFGIEIVHVPTGVDYTFKEYYPAHNELDLTLSDIAIKYGHLKP